MKLFTKYSKFELFYKFFMNYLNVILIVPKNSAKPGCLRKIKIILVAFVHTGCFMCNFYVRSTSNFYKTGRQMKYIQDINEGIIFFHVLLVYKDYLKHDVWRSILNDNIDLIKVYINNTRIFKVIVTFLTIHLMIFSLWYMDFLVVYKELRNPYNALLLRTSTWMTIYHIICTPLFATLLLLEVRMQLVYSRNTLSDHIDKIKEAKVIFRKVEKTMKFINELFGYKMIFLFGSSLILLVGMSFGLYIVMGTNTLEFQFSSMWEPLAIFGSNIILVLVGPCAIAFTSDMVKAETGQLLNTCLELQERFNYESPEYRELNSFGCYVANINIRFTAADFFEIKRSTLLSVIATSTTYFIALVQFY